MSAFLSLQSSLVLGLLAFGLQLAVGQEAALSSHDLIVSDAAIEMLAQESKPVQTQVSGGLQTSVEINKKQKEEKKKREKRGSFVIAPIPISNPALGSGIVPVVGFIFPITRKDKVSPPSVIGTGGLITDNGSRAFALVAQLYFKQNTYKSTAIYARGNLNYDLYGSGVNQGLKLPLIQTGSLFHAEFLRRVAWHFFLGPRFLIGSSLITVAENGNTFPEPPPEIGLNTRLTSLGVRLTRDTSINRFYPTNGTYFTVTSDFYSPVLGSKYTLQSYTGSFNKYWKFGERQVLAYDAYGCATGGSPPFYMNCIYGSGNELRGYVAGRYFDRYMATTQIEERVALPYRLGVVGFGGIGEAIPGGDQFLFRHNEFLPAGGVGLRILLSKAYHVNLRSDFAWGKDGHTFILGIGEAF
jgi:hypothetical protein